MRVIISGNRNIRNPLRQIKKAVKDSSYNISFIVCAVEDESVQEYANQNDIPFICYSLDRIKHGNSAEYMRVTRMVENADALIALWTGKDKLTEHAIIEAHKIGLRTFVFEVLQ